MLVTPNNLKVMMKDTTHSFGHGYCLAMALLDLDEVLDDDAESDNAESDNAESDNAESDNTGSDKAIEI